MTLVLLNETLAPSVVRREPEGVARYENELRDMLFESPEILPLDEIEPGIGRVVSVARELNVPNVGRIDALLVDERGRLVIVECKLWRNPQARREVVGQILDYAQALARFDYEDLQREISSATKRQGNVLFELVREAGGETDEARFVDRVSRDLAAGRFLLVIVGDGITEGAQRISEYLQTQPGLAFTFGMVEMAQYRFQDAERERTIVQPRLITKTQNIERIVIRNEASSVAVEAVRDNGAPPTPAVPPRSSEARDNWRAFAERLIAEIQFDDPGQAKPRNGGMGWLRVPLPPPGNLTLWRSLPQQVVGAFARFTGPDGLAAIELLEDERASIDAEFVHVNLPAPEWERKDTEGSISITLPAPTPWTEQAEAEQRALLAKLANQFVNSLRPRLSALNLG